MNQNHEGRYTCTPYNAQGTQGSSGPMEVLVRKPPVFTIEPDSMYQRKVGETVEMHCDAQETEGTQKPTIQWQRVSICVHFYIQSYMHIYQSINFKVLNKLSLPKGSLNQPVKIYLLRKCKCRVTSGHNHHAVVAYNGHGGKSPHILDLESGWRRSVSFTFCLLYSTGDSF